MQRDEKCVTMHIGQRKTERRWSFMRLSDTIEAFIKEMMQEEQMEVLKDEMGIEVNFE